VAAVIAALHSMDRVEVHSLRVTKDDEDTIVQADLRSSSPSLLRERLAELAERPDVEDVETGS
jgi:hypothetical protein